MESNSKTLATNLQQKAAIIANLEAKSSSLNGTITDLETKISSLENEIQTLNTSVKTAQDHLNTFKKRCEGLESSLKVRECGSFF